MSQSTRTSKIARIALALLVPFVFCASSYAGGALCAETAAKSEKFNEWDEDGNASVSLAEFRTGLKAKLESEQKSKAKAKSAKGSVDLSSKTKVSWDAEKEQWSQDVSAMFATLDEDEDNSISLGEFLNYDDKTEAKLGKSKVDYTELDAKSKILDAKKKSYDGKDAKLGSKDLKSKNKS